jgi:hypothetical protein
VRVRRTVVLSALIVIGLGTGPPVALGGQSSSSDGTLAVLATRTHATTNLTVLASTLPHRASAERAVASWRSDFRR